ncbi:MAG TPA: CAP domain-containing protein [Terracidiphilus sp.]|nr:CAP domain-containing protein [Terracidiphilus sp.]
MGQRNWVLVLAMIAGMLGTQRAARAQQGGDPVVASAGEQLMALANRSRAQAGVGRLDWDDQLAAAAREHCLRMAQEGPIAHRYAGEADMSTRAGNAGAHFDVIEENVAVGPSAQEIHEEWMQSPGHRANLLSRDVNRVGIAVVAARGVLYAVADYSHGVQSLNSTQVEDKVAGLVHAGGVTVLADHAQARAACGTDSGIPRGGMQPTFVMRWQDASLSDLPRALAQKLASGQYHQAEVGSCPAQNVDGQFTAYRVAVLLY